MAVVELMDYVYGCLDRGGACVTGLFIDLMKTCDTIDHDMLLTCCENAGITGLPLTLWENYLSGHVQTVSVAGVISPYREIATGVSDCF